ncbi:MAG: leucine-rich repeat protein [Ruminococcus sp.]|nr:leucine-rich repeat protein [Ruminococcus sp.]
MNKKKLLAGVLSLAMAFSTLPSLGAVSATSFAAESTAAASDTEDNKVVIDGLTYKVYNDHAELNKCDEKASGDIVIAGEVAGEPVTVINGSSFTFCFNVTSVKIPAKVTRIGDHLAGYATSLATYTVDEKNENFCSVDGIVYTKDMKKLVAYPPAYPTTEFTVPSSVEMIGYGSAYTAAIESLIIPDSVTAVEDFAFTYCKSLKSVKLPSGLKSIGYSSFGNTALESVELPPVLEVMDSSAFDGCRQLKSVTVTNPATVIKDGAIPANEGLVIRGYEGSTAQTYAEENNIAFEKITGGSLSTTPTKVTTTTTTQTIIATTTTTASTTTAAESQITPAIKYGMADPIVKVIGDKPYEIKLFGMFEVSGEKVLDEKEDAAKIAEIKEGIVASLSQAVMTNNNITRENFKSHSLEIAQAAKEHFNKFYVVKTGYELFSLSINSSSITEQAASVVTAGTTTATSAASTTTTTTTTTAQPSTTTTAETLVIYAGSAAQPKVEAGTKTTIVCPDAYCYNVKDGQDRIKNIEFTAEFTDDIKVLGTESVTKGNNSKQIYLYIDIEIPDTAEGNYNYTATVKKATDINGNDITSSLPWTTTKHSVYVAPKGTLETIHTFPTTTTSSGTSTTTATTTSASTQTTTASVTFNPTTNIVNRGANAGTTTTYTCIWGYNYNLVNGQDTLGNVDFDVEFAEDIKVISNKIEIKTHNAYNSILFTAEIQIPETANGRYDCRVIINKVTDKNGNDITDLLPSKRLSDTLSVKKATTTSTSTATTTASTTSTSATTTASTTTTPPVTSELTLAEKIVGSWKFDRFENTLGEVVDEFPNSMATIGFNKYGTGSIDAVSEADGHQTSVMTWTVNGDVIEMSLPGFAENEYIAFKLNDSGELISARSDGTLIFKRVKDAVDLGDANQDGSVDAKDASFILVAYAKASTGSEDGLTDTQREAADVNTDGKVDAKDASAILAYYAYLSTGGSDDLVTFLKK